MKKFAILLMTEEAMNKRIEGYSEAVANHFNELFKFEQNELKKFANEEGVVFLTEEVSDALEALGFEKKYYQPYLPEEEDEEAYEFRSDGRGLVLTFNLYGSESYELACRWY